ncbi:MAG TPA: type II toxin-antitoxin system Phd/YefM family antitoxin [Thermoanaerobaculia bacterium]|jgi:PHD/YefM family antitoxin component YafN of YafNO toxin-antitoxin module
MEKRLELLELSPDVRQLVGECEVTGKRTIFERDGRPVAILVSHDEYLALRETIDIANNPDLRRQIEAAEDEVKRNALMLPEELFEGGRQKDEG